VTREDLKRASATLRALNPHLAHFFGAPAADSARHSLPPKVGAPPFSHGMNKTEREYGLVLEALKRRGEVLRYEYEGLTLRWADMRYTPDFVVFLPLSQPLKLIEVKGAHIWDRDIVRFKGARAYWPEFRFEMWQKARGQWRRLH